MLAPQDDKTAMRLALQPKSHNSVGKSLGEVKRALCLYYWLFGDALGKKWGKKGAIDFLKKTFLINDDAAGGKTIVVTKE